MKKIMVVFVALILLTVIVLSLYGCQKGDDGASVVKPNRFFVVDGYSYGVNCYAEILCDKETKVMYVFYKSGYGGGLCPLYNADGTLMLYWGEN